MVHLRASQPTLLLRVHRAALIREECRSVRLQIRLGVGQRRLQLGDARVRLIERRRYGRGIIPRPALSSGGPIFRGVGP